ncbi:MAG: LPS export ABC transporter periplasmic protein LptC [Legionellales bacterium RIFCSPHIGHO2_12_FULL_37_14]|nr:MAG: LPS export ABC transporter periplasmic protein LptC [Legionellales bacterium RIFCSPHIGHO2_12_FULL_37_14]
MNLASTFLLSIILVIMGVLGWYFGSIDSKPRVSEQSLSVLPDIILHEVNLFEFNEIGKVARKVTATKLTHIPDNDQYHFNDPNIHFHDHENKLWHLVSKYATTKQGFEAVVFEGQVLMQEINPKDPGPFNLSTEYLTYLPKKAQAYTDAAVEIKQVGHTINAKQGMKADLNTKHILLRRAKAVLLPKSHM